MTVPFSMHDREGHVVVPKGGFCVDTVALSENPSPVNYHSINGSINWIVRLNWGYSSTGTIPPVDQWEQYLLRAHDYILRSSGIYAVIPGNEPNIEWERPNGAIIEPEHIAWVFSKLKERVKSTRPETRFITTPVGPYHANPTPWHHYLSRMLKEIEKLSGIPDGIGLHAYARSMEPSAITSVDEMQDPLGGLFHGFLTYRDALSQVPLSMAHLPAYCTEFNVIPDWENRNTGIIKAAYKEIEWWNRRNDTQKVICLTLFRWKQYEGQRWGLEDEPEVLNDFKQAIEAGFNVPEPVSTHIPAVSTPQPVPLAITQPKIDPEAIQYGVLVNHYDPKPADNWVWRVKEVQFLNEKESQGRHHFYFDTLDENGNRKTGVKIFVRWPTGNHTVVSEAKPGEPYSANYAFSPGKNAFEAHVLEDNGSDTVTGAGMGQEYPEGFNKNVHTSIVAIFQREKAQVSTKPPLEKQKVPVLAHPVENPRLRTITQVFGVNEHVYRKWGLKGHNGVDFGTPVGSVIVAVDDGTVIEVLDDTDGYGKYVKMVHSWGETLYAHLSQQLVTPGTKVRKGSRIGLSGNTGNSTGPHLHFGLRVNPYRRDDGFVGYRDPLPYLDIVTKPVPAIDLQSVIKAAATKYGLEWELLASMAWAESSFKVDASNGGLFQITLPTWDEIAPRVGATDRYNLVDNVEVAAYYLTYLKEYYEGNIYNAVLAYNHGIGNVDNKVPTSAHTKEYVNKVFHGRDLLKALGVR